MCACYIILLYRLIVYTCIIHVYIYVNEKMVEDKCHALMVCPKFEVMRGELMEIVSQHLPNFFFCVFLTQAEKFCFIMSSLEPLVIKALAKFVSVILNSKRA